jgi:nitrile hydratase beta subunit
MKLQHNLGGLENLGPINFEKKVFVQPWEERIFGIHVAMMGLSNHLPVDSVPTKFNSEWTWADLRKGAEAMHPFEYFKFRYYEKWLGGISSFFVEQGYITQEELDEKMAQFLNSESESLPGGGNPEIDAQVIKYLRVGDSPKRDTDLNPKYKVGDEVVIKDLPPADHTRLPGYLRDKKGIIDTVYEGSYTYFCKTSDGIGEPMPVYCIEFDPKDLWGDLSEANSTVYADIFEAYIC